MLAGGAPPFTAVRICRSPPDRTLIAVCRLDFDCSHSPTFFGKAHLCTLFHTTEERELCPFVFARLCEETTLAPIAGDTICKASAYDPHAPASRQVKGFTLPRTAEVLDALRLKAEAVLDTLRLQAEEVLDALRLQAEAAVEGKKRALEEAEEAARKRAQMEAEAVEAAAAQRVLGPPQLVLIFIPVLAESICMISREHILIAFE